ncbi:ROK family protein [Candidatus Woesearchaeota archaeon]|nr:ROK family protein [Candidatus Woesearchaeota archaeon]
MLFTQKQHKKFNKKGYNSFILGADIGGTNTSLGVFGIKGDSSELLLSFHFKSRELGSLHNAITEALGYIIKNYKIKIAKACIAGAGIVSPDRSSISITKLRWNLKRKELCRNTDLKKIIFINDFEAIGYGISMLKKADIAVIKKAHKIPEAPIVVIGAGTGLGKTTLVYDEHYESYRPIPSEAGHCDFPAQGRQEIEIVDFIKKRKKIRQNASYEQVVSGIGLENIYAFLRKKGKIKPTKYTKEADKAKNKPQIISKYRKTDETCRKTFEIFRDAYAKFAANCALDALPYGGIYIAGGIAPKNRDIFDDNFVKAFESCHERSDVLKKIPIYLVVNYNAGLLGAGFFGARLFGKK